MENVVRWRAMVDDGTRLTPRQCEIVDMVAAGLTNPEIAARLAITRASVANQLTGAYIRAGIAGEFSTRRARLIEWWLDQEDVRGRLRG